MPEFERQALMLGVVRARDEERVWRKLYGMHLSFDERFFAVMSWSWKREWLEVREQLRERHRQLRLSTQSAARVALRPVHREVGVAGLAAASGSLAMFSGPKALLGPSLAERMYGRNGAAALFGRGEKASRALASIGTVPASEPLGLASLGKTVGDPFRTAAIARAGRQQLAFASVSRAASEQLSGLWQVAGLRAVRPPRVATSWAAGTRPDLGLKADVTGLGYRFPDSLVKTAGLDVSRLAFPGGAGRVGEWPGLRALVQGPFLDPKAPWLDAARGLRDFIEPFHRTGTTLVALVEFVREWDGDPMWFMVGEVGMNHVTRLVVLSREEVQEAVFLAVEAVVRDGKYIAALRSVVSKAPYLNDIQREWLDDGLEHAAAGQWVKAVLNLLAGLEGAFAEAGIAEKFIVEKRGKVDAVEKLVKAMDLDENYERFLRSRFYGGPGNAFRHGRASAGAREQVLLGVVALAGWVEHFLGRPARQALVARGSRHMVAAIEQVAERQSQLPPSTE